MNQPNDQPVNGYEIALLGVVASLVLVGALVLAGGAAASYVFGGGWTWPPSNALLSTVLRLVTRPTRPAEAYPEALQDGVAPAGPFWGVVGLVLAGTLSVATVVAIGFLSRRTRSGFADATSLRETTRARKGQEEGIAFARYAGAQVRARAEDAAVIIAPPRAGKTTRLAAPLVVAAAGSVVATSTKADLVRLTAGQRQQHGPVHVVDFDHLMNWPDPARWDLVEGCADVREATVRSKALVAGRPLTGTKNGDFFAEAADTVLRCLLHAAALGGGNVRDVAAWARDFDDDEPYDILRRHPGAAPGWVDDLRKYCRGGAPETVASTDMSLGLILKPLADPQVLELVCPRPGQGFDVGAFVNNPTPSTLFILSEGGGEMSTAPLVTALVAAIERAGRRASQRNQSGRMGCPLTFVLDEVANVAPLPNLPSLISDGGGRGMQTWAFAQTPAQLRDRWGRDGADAILGAAAITLIMGGLDDVEFLDRFSRLAGERKTVRKSRTQSGRTSSTSTSVERERVLPVEDLRTLKDGKALLMYRSVSPALVDLTGWWARSDAKSYRESLAWVAAQEGAGRAA